MVAVGSEGAPRPEAPADVLRYARMLRPFPIKALADLLYHVDAAAVSLAQHLNRLLIDPPREADLWVQALDQIDEQLWSLAEYADAARARLPGFVDRADAEGERAASALRAIMRDLSLHDVGPHLEPGVGPSSEAGPMPCPHCGGHGGSVSDGHCDHCEGTGIDPEDPAFPA